MSEETVQPTPQQKMAAVKSLLMQQFGGVYNQLIRFVRELPIDDKLREYAVMNLDQGAMWVDQGVKALNFEVTPLPAGEPNNAAEEGKQPEDKQQEHQDGAESGCAAEAGSCNSPVSSEEVKAQEEVNNPG